MPRLSIDITAQEHQKLKAMAALKGQSIKEFVLTRTLSQAPAISEMTEEEAIAALSQFLKPGSGQVIRNESDTISLDDIRKLARERAGLS